VSDLKFLFVVGVTSKATRRKKAALKSVGEHKGANPMGVEPVVKGSAAHNSDQ